jgi:hypothetical protein
MKFSSEKFISNFVESQFPQFYQEEGPNFILFVKAYYEWLESENQSIYQGRRLFEYRDVDTTSEEFLEYFLKKYLYGIPFNVIANKRFLLKHILDVYRSKGTIQCYRLLFKLLYNEDIEIYLPGRDILRASDGTWIEPRYLEVTNNTNLANFVGKVVVGVSSGTSAVVENFVKESYNNDIINIIYITNVLPRGGNFEIGEKILLPENLGKSEFVSAAPTVLGSLDSINVINGGQGFNIGDIIKIANKNSNNEVVSFGVDGVLKITELSRGFGSLNFDVIDGGFGFTANAETFVYKNSANGQGASFDIGTISSTQTIEYNSDIICDYLSKSIDSTTYNFPSNTSANLTSVVGTSFSYANQVFGSILNLSNIKTGNAYNQPANVFVRSIHLSNNLTGNVSYSKTSNTVTGVSTIFASIFANDDVIALQANSSLSSTLELAVIKNVVSNTEILLYGPPTINSTASAKYKAAPTILPSQFALYETEMFTPNQSVVGENELIRARPSTGNNVASRAVVINSGKGYSEGEEITAYLFGAISNNITILNGGDNYSNGDVLIFAGGNPGTTASGFVTTDSNGTIVSTTLSFAGSGYETIPNIRVKSTNGSDATLIVTLTDFNTSSEITGRVVKIGIGKARGYWSTTRGFLNSDKYIQDSFYYQDFSYEIKVAQTLSDYKNILYNTFHSSGSELFGKYLQISTAESNTSILFEQSAATIS